MTPRIIIVGAGIIGSSTAWRLAQRGLRVLLFDAGRMGGEASSAGAGMLAPGGELTAKSGWHSLALESLAMYAGFVAELEEESGCRIDYRRCGAVEVALQARDWLALQAKAASQATIGIRSRPMEFAEVARQVPGICRDGIAGAMWYPDEAVADPRDIMRALETVSRRRGIEIREQCRVGEIRPVAGGVEIDGERGEAAVIAAGAWSGEIAVVAGDAPIPIPPAFPIRGHLAAYACEPGRLGPILRCGHTYLLQRESGRLLVGASEEEVGFDRRLQPEIVDELASRGRELLPGLLAGDPDDSWIGFRPATASRAPEIRRLGGTRLWLAYGHYRNGILLAPVTAKLLAAEITASLGMD